MSDKQVDAWGSLGLDDPQGVGQDDAYAQGQTHRNAESPYPTTHAEVDLGGDASEEVVDADVKPKKKSKAGIFLVMGLVGIVVLGVVFMILSKLMSAMGGGASSAASTGYAPLPDIRPLGAAPASSMPGGLTPGQPVAALEEHLESAVPQTQPGQQSTTFDPSMVSPAAGPVSTQAQEIGPSPVIPFNPSTAPVATVPGDSLSTTNQGSSTVVKTFPPTEGPGAVAVIASDGQARSGAAGSALREREIAELKRQVADANREIGALKQEVAKAQAAVKAATAQAQAQARASSTRPATTTKTAETSSGYKLNSTPQNRVVMGKPTANTSVEAAQAAVNSATADLKRAERDARLQSLRRVVETYRIYAINPNSGNHMTAHLVDPNGHAVVVRVGDALMEDVLITKIDSSSWRVSTSLGEIR